MDMWPGRVGGGESSIFLGYILHYIRRLHVTDEYSFIFHGTEELNVLYSSMLYFSMFFHRLTEEYKLYFSV
jgi:hypothetical protein